MRYRLRTLLIVLAVGPFAPLATRLTELAWTEGGRLYSQDKQQ
jgi:hypothetical protein